MPEHLPISESRETGVKEKIQIEVNKYAKELKAISLKELRPLLFDKTPTEHSLAVVDELATLHSSLFANVKLAYLDSLRSQIQELYTNTVNKIFIYTDALRGANSEQLRIKKWTNQILKDAHQSTLEEIQAEIAGEIDIAIAKEIGRLGGDIKLPEEGE